MRKLLLCIGVAVGIGQARADVPPGAACSAAGHQAEQDGALPTNLLLSIGMVESGHPDPATGRMAPWPWTVNADGNGQYFPTKEAAMAFVRFAQEAGARDIDVGCFQISLESHPDAFASLDEAFDPGKNATYAARFLSQLKGRTGSWTTAIADYHSALPDLGLPYQRLVLAAWKRMGNLPFNFTADVQEASYIPPPDNVAIIQSAAAKRIHVYTSSQPMDAAWRPGLPHVYEGN